MRFSFTAKRINAGRFNAFCIRLNVSVSQRLKARCTAASLNATFQSIKITHVTYSVMPLRHLRLIYLLEHNLQILELILTKILIESKGGFEQST